jgi:hypothetical protein
MIEFAMTSARWETIRGNDIQLRGIDAVCAQLQTGALTPHRHLASLPGAMC